jgi:hypothetical protein
MAESVFGESSSLGWSWSSPEPRLHTSTGFVYALRLIFSGYLSAAGTARLIGLQFRTVLNEIGFTL